MGACSSPLRSTRLVASLVAGALVVVACSGDDDRAADTTSPATSTTIEATTTTKSTTTTTNPPTTTTTEPKRADPCKAQKQARSAKRRSAADGRRRRAESSKRSSTSRAEQRRQQRKGWIGPETLAALSPEERGGDDRRDSGDRRRSDGKHGDDQRRDGAGRDGNKRRNDSKASGNKRRNDAKAVEGKRRNDSKRHVAKRDCAANKPKPTTTHKPKPKPKPLRRMPLTGRILGKHEALPQRPALVVKIDNHPDARPQYGLNSADIVFEEIVEWGTRFAAVFHSEGSNPVGPIRSGRTQDIKMLGRLHRPLFAWSGGNPNVTSAIAGSDLVDLNAAFAGGYYRGRGYAPHNLYNTTDALWSQTPPGWKQPGQYFDYLEPGESFGGPQAAGVEVNLDGMTAWWGWNPAEEAYVRATSGSPHYDGHGGQVRARNVVVLETTYFPSPADARSPEAQTIGSGRAWVFSDGHVIKGTWSRSGPTAPFDLRTADGKHVIELRSGRTFVELAETSVDGEPRILPVPGG